MTFPAGTTGTAGTGLDNQGFSPSRFFNFCPVCPVLGGPGRKKVLSQIGGPMRKKGNFLK